MQFGLCTLAAAARLTLSTSVEFPTVANLNSKSCSVVHDVVSAAGHMDSAAADWLRPILSETGGELEALDGSTPPEEFGAAFVRALDP